MNESLKEKKNIKKQEYQNFNRSIKIDIIKGIAIFCVLWGHYIQYTSTDTFDYFENNVFKFIYSFHMPLFALVSGYLFYVTLQKKNLKDVIYSRITGLIIPIVIWTTIDWSISFILKRSTNLIGWLEAFTGSYLWFLWSILAISIYLALVNKLLPNKMHIMAIVIGFLAMYLFPNPEMNLYMYPFFIIGYYTNKCKEKLKKYTYNKYRFLIIPVFIILLFFFKKECYIYTTGITIWNSELGVMIQLMIDIYRYVIGLLGSISVIILIDKIVEKMPESIKKFFVNCGKYSMQIYILQCLIFRVYTMIWNKMVKCIGVNILTNNMFIYNLIITPIFAVITILLILFIAKKIEENQKISKIFFGR